MTARIRDYDCPRCRRDKAICRRWGRCGRPWEWHPEQRLAIEKKLGRRLPDRDPKAGAK